LPPHGTSEEDIANRDFKGVVEIVLKLALLFLVVGWCLSIISPFVGIVLWAMIIALGVEAPYQALARALGGRNTLAAVIFVIIALAGLVVPAVMLSETLINGAQHLAASLSAGDVAVPPPPEKVADWPLIGARVYEIWLLASENLAAALGRIGPELQALSKSLLGAAGAAGMALLQLAGSLIIAGFLLARSEWRATALDLVATRIAGARGVELLTVARMTVKSVVQGIVGVAVIQALLAGLGLYVVSVPAAGLWALLVLIAAIVQLPVVLVMLMPVLLVFANESTAVAAGFAAWGLFVSVIDNVLKPILFGRGVKLPTIVIFVGAIGGMLTMGIIGLFLGAVALAVGYELCRVWLADADLGDASDVNGAATEGATGGTATG
jgi:predicted PurR-regulated permease PerM